MSFKKMATTYNVLLNYRKRKICCIKCFSNNFSAYNKDKNINNENKNINNESFPNDKNVNDSHLMEKEFSNITKDTDEKSLNNN